MADLASVLATASSSMQQSRIWTEANEKALQWTKELMSNKLLSLTYLMQDRERLARALFVVHYLHDGFVHSRLSNVSQSAADDEEEEKKELDDDEDWSPSSASDQIDEEEEEGDDDDEQIESEDEGEEQHVARKRRRDEDEQSEFRVNKNRVRMTY